MIALQLAATHAAADVGIVKSVTSLHDDIVMIYQSKFGNLTPSPSLHHVKKYEVKSRAFLVCTVSQKHDVALMSLAVNHMKGRHAK